MVSYFTDIFKYEKFPVEYECYKQLKDQDINYVAVPWTQILNTHWLNFPNKQPIEYYLKILSKEKIDTQNNITVCQHDSYLRLKAYFKHLNITKVFACAINDYDTMDGIEIISMPYINVFDFPNSEKDILVSFLGSVTHPVRESIKNNILDENIIFRDTYHITSNFFDENKNKEELEYIDILSRSRFSLCPRGTNPNSMRLWESLAAGAIPILISDDYKLPEWDWDNTIITLPESVAASLNANELYSLLHFDAEEENKMRENCYKAYDKFKKENYKDYIIENL